MLEELREHKLFVNAKNSEFFLTEFHYLGHIVSLTQVRMDPKKLKAILKWPRPANVHEARSFLGLRSYFGALSETLLL